MERYGESLKRVRALLPDPACIETNGREFILARNTGGEYHLVLFFGLKPQAKLVVTLREACPVRAVGMEI